jgi:hypothetical protein
MLFTPSNSWMVHHGLDGVVELLILVVPELEEILETIAIFDYNLQEDQFRPQMRLFGGTQNLRDVDTRPEEFQMFAHSFRLILGVQNCQLGEHSHI